MRNLSLFVFQYFCFYKWDKFLINAYIIIKVGYIKGNAIKGLNT
ncbi:hypothetical protein Desmer_0424 [Desulfosporosinus meridiei DSM 13257]|uniref:Uncharacterized protein n=1 Tax=Desulfosporosinus meridiei (strain ATCC BAA-275 / DSM 13257 / KCTC 12902 / NCIMB 13706 / S10) TaxID=768704 RepID=J7IQM1_DESMD|nr:hypothetical protein Desmer_0424 [Desulfosporosinus meridiei DSM 13257]